MSKRDESIFTISRIELQKSPIEISLIIWKRAIENLLITKRSVAAVQQTEIIDDRITKVSAKLTEKIVEFLISLPDIHNLLKPLIYNAALDSHLITQFDFAMPPKQFFQVLIPHLKRYGLLNRHLSKIVLAIRGNSAPSGMSCDGCMCMLRGASTSWTTFIKEKTDVTWLITEKPVSASTS